MDSKHIKERSTNREFINGEILLFRTKYLSNNYVRYYSHNGKLIDTRIINHRHFPIDFDGDEMNIFCSDEMNKCDFHEN